MRPLLSTIICYLGLIVVLSSLPGCHGHSKSTPYIDRHQAPRGVASWYGPSFHGKPSASGEPYDMWALTAAHQTLPFGTWVQVTSVRTGKSVTVRINDRGPFVKGRIIDLSYAAARELGMIGRGTAEVQLRILGSREPTDEAIMVSKHFWVQAGAFTSLRKAMTLREQLANQYEQVRVKTVHLASGEWHRVQVGTFDSKEQAQTAADALQKYLGAAQRFSILTN